MSRQHHTRSSRTWKKNEHDPTSGLLEGVVETLPLPILEGPEEDVVPEDLAYIGSYNWVDSSNPTIIVPGSPRVWADKEMPMTIPIDSGMNFIDQNGHRMKKFTLLPLIKTVQDLTDQGVTQKFDWPSVDFVTDRGRLRKLLAWATGVSDHWRIDTQLAGANTVLLSGHAPVTKETSGRSNSYGFNFEESSTYAISGLENEPSHHRIITYNFDGLKMVVRFEVDACLPYDTTPSGSPSNRPPSSRRVAKEESSSGPSSHIPNVEIIRRGSGGVPQTHLLEIKTHGGDYLHWPRTYPQLYLSQTPHIYHAFHKNGTFTRVEKFTVGQRELADVEKNAQEGFKKLKKLLCHIKSLVLKYGTARISLVCMDKTLCVYRIPQGESCLPEDALALFVA